MKQTYSDIYADAMTKTKNQIEDSRLEFLEEYEVIRERMKELEVILHALGDAGMKK